MIWVPPLWRLPRNTYPVAYLKHPEPGSWQRAADEMQAALARQAVIERAGEHALLDVGLFVAELFGERGVTSLSPFFVIDVAAVVRRIESNRCAMALLPWRQVDLARPWR